MEENTHTNESTESLPSSQVRLALEREFGARHFRNTETLGQFLKALRRGNVRENDLLPQPCLTCANGPGPSDCPTPEECMEPGTLWEPRPENLGPFPEQAEHRSLLERNLYLQRQRTAYQQDFVFVARRARLMRDTLQELLEACRNAPAKSLRMVEAMDHAGKALALAKARDDRAPGAPIFLLQVLDERDRQKSALGFSAEHDAQHVNGELIMAALYYLAPRPEHDLFYPSAWSPEWKGRSNEQIPTERDMVKAVALLLAEADRRGREGATHG